jgi:hypothetical protein
MVEPGKRAGSKPEKSSGATLLPEGGYLRVDDLRGKWLAVDPLQRPRAHVNLRVGTARIGRLDKSCQTDVGEGTRDIGEHLDASRASTARRSHLRPLASILDFDFVLDACPHAALLSLRLRRGVGDR